MNSTACPVHPETLVLGTRLSVYLPAILTTCPIPLLLVRKDDRDKLASKFRFPTGEYSLLVTLALLVTTFPLSPSTVYDATIVLNLAWINIASAFARFLFETYTIPNGGFTIYVWSLLLRKRRERLQKEEIFKWNHPRWRRQVVLFCLHLVVLGSFGLWLWALDSKFGNLPRCTAETTVVVFNRKFSALNQRLRWFSISIYAISTLPLLNLFILGVIITLAAELIFLCTSLLWSIAAFVLITIGVWREVTHRRMKLFSMWAMSISILLLESIFILDIEKMISVNRPNFASSERNDWTFGPILAMLFVLIPLLKTFQALRAFRLWLQTGPRDTVDKPSAVPERTTGIVHDLD